jgi:hypothetical protein
MYQDLFDEHHKMISFSPHERVKGVGHIKRPSSGIYESNLLCENCDNKVIGQYENYASRAMYGGVLPAEEMPKCTNYKNQENVSFTHCQNLNYTKFKLFLLSILWRASISRNDFFKFISLGPHEETIRKMILEGEPGLQSDYPIFCMTYLNDEKMPKDLVAHPQRKRTRDGHIVYTFIIGGMIYMYYVNSKSHILPQYIVSETLRPTNELNILHVPKGEGWKMIGKYYGFV